MIRFQMFFLFKAKISKILIRFVIILNVGYNVHLNTGGNK